MNLLCGGTTKLLYPISVHPLWQPITKANQLGPLTSVKHSVRKISYCLTISSQNKNCNGFTTNTDKIVMLKTTVVYLGRQWQETTYTRQTSSHIVLSRGIHHLTYATNCRISGSDLVGVNEWKENKKYYL